MDTTGPTSEAKGSAGRRRALVLAVVVIALGVLTFAGYAALVQLDAESNACDLTPPGFENQRLVEKETHALWTTCTLDPGNGDPRYTIHRPFESVRGLD